MKKTLSLIFLASYALSAQAFDIRNTYTAELICTEVNKPGTVYKIPANAKADDFSHVPSASVKNAGKYHCKTADNKYASVCEVSEFQEKATFNTNDGSVSCSTPVRVKK